MLLWMIPLPKEELWTLLFSQTNNNRGYLLLQGDFAKQH